MKDRVRKAVFPAAGLGTRFLPATKALPKEMLALVDKPLIQYAVDEARDRATQFGIVDDREQVVNHWRDVHTWFAPPVMVAGEVMGSLVGFEFLVGYTRLGNLLGLLDREDIPEVALHLVWVGRGMESR